MFGRLAILFALLGMSACTRDTSSRSASETQDPFGRNLLLDEHPIPHLGSTSPGKMRDGRPWEGTFISSSHKTWRIIESYKNGRRHGRSTGWHSEKIKHWDGFYVNGNKHGVFTIWNANGELWERTIYQNGKAVDEKQK